MRRWWFSLVLGGLLLAVAGAALAQRIRKPQSVTEASQAGPKVVTYKSPTCGCCTQWLARMREAGFAVEVVEVPPEHLLDIKARYGVPRELGSCHTAVVEGYVIEGHVPPQDVWRLLQERPAVTGLAVPGMPTGSPGMETPGGYVQPYTVFAFGSQGIQPFASYP